MAWPCGGGFGVCCGTNGSVTHTGDGFGGGGTMTDPMAIGLAAFIALGTLAMELVLFALMWFGEESL